MPFSYDKSFGKNKGSSYAWRAKDHAALADIRINAAYELSAVAFDNEGESQTSTITFRVHTERAAPLPAMPIGMIDPNKVIAVGPTGSCFIDIDQTTRCCGSRLTAPDNTAGMGDYVGRANPHDDIGTVVAGANTQTTVRAILEVIDNNGSNVTRTWTF